MATPKGRMDKDWRDPKAIPRRNSIPAMEEISLRDLLKEIQNISGKQDMIQKEVQAIAIKQDIQHKQLQEEITEFKRELREEVGFLKGEIQKNSNDIQELRTENAKAEKINSKLQRKVESIEAKSTKLEKMQERLEANESEYQLRFRNIQEEPKENIKQIIIQLTAKIMKCSEKEADTQIDKVFRIHTNFAKKNKVSRDVIVHFVKRSYRNDVLQNNRTKTLTYKDKKVVILKEFPQTILNRRRKYFFLTDELKRLQIRFRWEKYEGIMLIYMEEKTWITTEEKADEFYRRLKRDLAQKQTLPSTEKEKNPKSSKKRRYDSPKEGLDLAIRSLKVDDQEEPADNEEEEEEETLNE
nr:PREDICTED: MAR-binding filament-like protein 1 [Anolis carolinensis]|eukprot:XP_016854824.1 PREDICTED: MAR-binding filament-like protein 1 [Anolis carolinensis]